MLNYQNVKNVRTLKGSLKNIVHDVGLGSTRLLYFGCWKQNDGTMISQVGWEEFLSGCILHLPAAGWWLPPPHPEQCITSHKSASSGELQSCSSRAGTQWPQFLWEKSGSGHKVDRHLGMESWREDGGHWRLCISTHCMRWQPDSHRIWPSIFALFLQLCLDLYSWIKRQNGLSTESPMVLYAELELINWHDTVTLSLYNWTNLPQSAHSHAHTIHQPTRGHKIKLFID